MKQILYIIMMLVLVSSAFAFTRGISGTQITYTATGFDVSKTKAYWAVSDVLSGTGCSLTNIATTTCGTNCQYSISSNTIRLVAFPPSEAGTIIGNTKSITVTGAGTGCVLTGEYAEAAGVAGQKLSISPQGTISFGGGTCTLYGDTYPACDGIKRGELSIVAQAWINSGGEATLRTKLSLSAQDWINHGGPA